MRQSSRSQNDKDECSQQYQITHIDFMQDNNEGSSEACLKPVLGGILNMTPSQRKS